MFTQFLIRNAGEVLRENFPNGCAVGWASSDLDWFRDLLTLKTRINCPLSNAELIELICSVGTLKSGRVYAPKSKEENAASSEKRPNDDAASLLVNDSQMTEKAENAADPSAETADVAPRREERRSRRQTFVPPREAYSDIAKIPRDELPPETFKRVVNILYKHFKDGLNLDRAKDLSFFRACAPSLFADKSAADLRTLIASAGTLVGSKVYVVLKTGRQYLTRLVERLFENEGFGVIYFEAFFKRFEETLAEHRFVSLELLEERLRAYFPNYAFYDEYFEPTPSGLSESEIVLREIGRVWNGDATSLFVLASWTLIPEDVVEYFLTEAPEYDCLGSGSRFGLNEDARLVRRRATDVTTSVKSVADLRAGEDDIASQDEARKPSSVDAASQNETRKSLNVDAANFSQQLRVNARQVLRTYFPQGCKAVGASIDLYRFGRLLSQETGRTLDLARQDLLDLLYAVGRAGAGGKIYPGDSALERDEKSGEIVKGDDAELKAAVANALAKNFANGYSLTSDVDAATLRRCDPAFRTLSDVALRKLVANVGSRVGERVYVSAKDERAHLTELVDGLFAEGRLVVYYETFFERFKASLIERRLLSLEPLKKRLRAYFPNYAFYDDFFEAEKTTASEPKRALAEIERVWNGEEIALDVLADWVLIPKAKIRAYLNASPKYKYCGGGRYASKTTEEKRPERVAETPTPSEKTPLTPTNDDASERKNEANANKEKALQTLLNERFPNGFRLGSPIEKNRLRRFVAESRNDELAGLAQLDDEALQNVVESVGTVYDGKVYVADATFDATIKTALENAFESGAQTVFYESFFAKIAASAPDYFSPNLLKERVEALFADSERKLVFAKNYVNIYIYTTETYVDDEATERERIEAEILRVWSDASCERASDLRDRLPYIPTAKIDAVLADSRALLSVDKELYARLEALDVPTSERENALNFARNKVLEDGYLTIGELPLGRLESLNEEASPELLRRVLFELALSKEFRLYGRLISELGETLNLAKIVRRFCRNTASRLELSEIRDFALNLVDGEVVRARRLALEAAWETLVCSEPEVFLPDDRFYFDVEAIDAALDAFFDALPLKREHVGAKEFASFSNFPLCGVAWNLCVLESYCRRFSRRYRWEAWSFNASSAGVVFKRDSSLTLIDAASERVAAADVLLEKEAASNVLILNGYIAGGGRFAKMDEILAKAKKLREEAR